MSTHRGLVVARMHGVLVTRPGSPVFHVYSSPLTPSGRFIPRAARPVCSARTKRLVVLERVGSVLDPAGRRLCGRCSARLSALARRAEQPPSNVDARKAFWEGVGITSTDLVVALALAASVEETYAIGNVTNLLFGRVDPAITRRPAEPGKAQGRWDFERQLLACRDALRLAELSPEDREQRAAEREAEAMRDEQIRAARRRGDAMARALDRRLAGRWLTPYERELLNSA